MKLTVETLKEKKAFSARPVEVEFEWKGDKITTYVRPLSYQTAVGDIRAANGGDVYALRIAASICDEDGHAVFTVSDITGEPVYNKAGELTSDPERGALDPELTNLLLIEIGKVQNLGKAPS